MTSTTEGASDSVEAVLFSFMTAEEVRKHSVMKITNPILLDSVGGPMPGGLYDPVLGAYDRTICKSCGQISHYCPGHCGHVDLVSPVYNPLLFSLLHRLLKKTCFFCLHFRSSRKEVERYASQLKLIAEGDIVEAKRLDLASTGESFYPEDSDGSFVHQSPPLWTTLQFTEAMAVLNQFLSPKSGKCSNCGAKNPKITRPTFGWLHMGGMSIADTKANIIRGHKLEGHYTDRIEERPSSEVVNADECASEHGVDDAEINSTTVVSDGIEGSVKKELVNKGGRVPLEFLKQKNTLSRPLLPSEVRDIIKLLWQNEAQICSFICDIQQGQLNSSGKIAGSSMFFLEAILVPPINFRPPAKGGDSVMEHPHTVLLGKVLESNIALGNALVNKTERSRIVRRWMDLQQSINVLFDRKIATGQAQRDGSSGICQLLDKKEGIFRQKMMGKRVNFACRSVISPDPYLAVNEIGIPPYFALRLTYPERVTPWNVSKLRDAIINGPDIHPGATNYTDKVGNKRIPNLNKKMRVSISRKLPSSRGMVTQSGKSSEYELEGKIVYRHLKDGDIVLVNRQPTLHKPSIMAHVVRVLKGEKTLRMHYANCSTFNADFDGDEMNVHLPQDEISRAEAYNIVNANNQYIVPTRGDTVRGLIQDHIVSAVLLTTKDTFLTREEYDQLIYSSGVSAAGASTFSGNSAHKISVVNSEGVMQPVLPAVWKPKPLWTGKQVITALLNHLTRGCTPFTVEKEGKIPHQYFASKIGRNESKEDEHNAESKLLIWKNELVHGVIDKAQFGKYGLVHTVQELYGSNTAGILLSVLSRLFTIFLQTHGFTCGVDDLIILPHCDIQRMEELEGEDIGEEVHCDFVQFKRGQIGPRELQLEIEKAICRNGQSAIASLDMKMKNSLTKKGSKISKELLLKGLLKLFPKNCVSLMTISGAKGSSVNFQQISSYLGQQELEGKRVPRMVSGKTLPSFPPWDVASRAGGFITDRFLTGLRPQEYYFHCMAGREGLVDTAVKTSRSGYLQRCLVKNLECLKVCYDYTVRDADGSVIQFYYGEDGVDVHQTSFLNKFEALAANQEIICQKIHHQLEYNAYIDKLPDGLKKKAQQFAKKLPTKDQKSFWKLMKQKYISSLAHSGEPVGVIAAQSVGEPSTQMTLNTFHLAGRGEMNVTLGIPRLQEILTTASSDIQTPITTCPLQGWMSKKDAKALVANLKKVAIADLIESIEVHILPLSIHNHQISRIYKLIMTLKEHELVSLADCQKTLKFVFLRELEDAIENHVMLLSKISGIKNFTQSADEIGEDAASESTAERGEQSDEDDGAGDEMAEDLGSDAQKRKLQVTDEMDYEDASADELSELESSSELDKETDQAEDGVEIRENGEGGDLDVSGDASEMQHGQGVMPTSHMNEGKLKSKGKGIKKDRMRQTTKDSDRAVSVTAEGLYFEFHFRFTNEPHILLAQIAQKTAKKVNIKSAGKIEMCKMVPYDQNEKQVLWDGKKISGPDEKMKANMQTMEEDSPAYWALKAAGVDFQAFWNMKDELDFTRIYSNNIHAMLNTFGVEAARAAIIMEVKHVFGIYGVEIDYRHLSLIADHMTHSGGYQPMSRHGSIAGSISPFLKMSFETASKFLVQAGAHGLTDNLESPSARICLGLPVKMGTGCFDLMQKLEI